MGSGSTTSPVSPACGVASIDGRGADGDLRCSPYHSMPCRLCSMNPLWNRNYLDFLVLAVFSTHTHQSTYADPPHSILPTWLPSSPATRRFVHSPSRPDSVSSRLLLVPPRPSPPRRLVASLRSAARSLDQAKPPSAHSSARRIRSSKKCRR